jgi:hypothetical protein
MSQFLFGTARIYCTNWACIPNNELLLDEKKKKIETVKTLTIVETHFKDFSCSEFFSQISEEKVFMEHVQKSDNDSGESGKAFAE